MHKNDFFPFIFFSYHSFSLSYLDLQIIFPCRDIGPATATATLDPRPRHWPPDRDFGPATRDPRLVVKLVSFCKISLKVLLLRLLLSLYIVCSWLRRVTIFIACNPTTDQSITCQQLCNWPIGYSVSGLTESLFTTKESFLVCSQSLIVVCNREIRTRWILREKAGCKRASIKPGTWNIPEHSGTSRNMKK